MISSQSKNRITDNIKKNLFSIFKIKIISEVCTMDSYFFYGLAFILLVVSCIKDKKKTKMALKKAWKSFENILPELLVIMLLIGVLLAVVDH